MKSHSLQNIPSNRIKITGKKAALAAAFILLVLLSAAAAYEPALPKIAGYYAWKAFHSFDRRTGRLKLDDGAEIYYEIHGRGRPLLLLHGGFGFSDTFFRQIPVLAEKYTIIAPDSRAQGRSTGSDEPLTYELMADDMIRLLDHLHIERTAVVGFSDGGIIGLDLARRHPERLERLVAIGANFHPDGLTTQALEAAEGTGSLDYHLLVRVFHRLHARTPDRWPIMVGLIHRLWLTQPQWTEDDLAAIRAPTLVMAGEDEEFIRREHTLALHRAIPGALLYIVPGTGHTAPMKRPDVVNQLIVDFLQGRLDQRPNSPE